MPTLDSNLVVTFTLGSGFWVGRVQLCGYRRLVFLFNTLASSSSWSSWSSLNISRYKLTYYIHSVAYIHNAADEPVVYNSMCTKLCGRFWRDIVPCERWCICVTMFIVMVEYISPRERLTFFLLLFRLLCECACVPVRVYANAVDGSFIRFPCRHRQRHCARHRSTSNQLGMIALNS